MPVLPRLSITLLLLAMLTACASLPEEVAHQPEPLATHTTTTLSTLTSNYRLTQAQHDMSAVRLQDNGWDALAQRLALVETAEHSIDIQYYIWNSDASGQYLASRLLAAAERGVHVRVMLDDINLNQREDLLAALDAHPRVEIRIFNPTPNRRGLVKWLDFVDDFSRLNRRMHNKSFTVDGVLSIVGGRNIGDEYFDLADDINFRDRDVMVMGAVVANIQASFGQYWDSRWSYPINLLGGNASSALPPLTELTPPRYQSYPALPANQIQARHLLTDVLNEMVWVRAYFVADRPVPADASNTSEPKTVARLLAKLASQSQQEIILESAYLIFDDRQLDAWQQLTANNVTVKALTNSMVSNDLITNHSGYAGRRQDMLEHGIELFELKPEAPLCLASTKDASKCAPTAAYGLHTKSVVFDQRIAGIGSFNFNLRSTYLNTESLLVIEDPDFAQRLAADMAQAMSVDNSWRLALHEGKPRWYSGSDSWDSEPDTEQWQRIKSRFLQLLPIEKYL